MGGGGGAGGGGLTYAVVQPTQDRGVCGHAPPGYFCYLYALKSILVHSETYIKWTHIIRACKVESYQ